MSERPVSSYFFSNKENVFGTLKLNKENLGKDPFPKNPG